MGLSLGTEAGSSIGSRRREEFKPATKQHVVRESMKTTKVDIEELDRLNP